MLDDIHKKNVEADERLAQAKDKVKEGDKYLTKAKSAFDDAEKLAGETKEARETAILTLSKTEQNYKEAREYLQTAKDKEAIADQRFKESKNESGKSANIVRNDERKRMIDSLENFIRSNYSSEQTKTKLSTFVRHFAEQIETL